MGVGDLVEEQTDRIPYSEALACLHDADALLAIGSNDKAYNASKLMPYLLAEKPLLAIFHEGSPSTTLLRKSSGVTIVTFADHDSPQRIAEQIARQWLRQEAWNQVVELNASEMEVLTDIGQAKVVCEFFDDITADARARC
jgi:hypothetical protein